MTTTIRPFQGFESHSIDSYSIDPWQPKHRTPSAPPVTTWAVTIQALGHFEVLIDNQSLQCSKRGQRKPLMLLKALLAHRGRARCETLIADIWPELEGDAGRRSFDLALHRLRNMLGQKNLVTAGGGELILDSTRVWSDVAAFEHLCTAISGLEDSSTPLELLKFAAMLPTLYTGDFLGNESAPWAFATCERLRSKFIRTVTTLGRLLERHRQWDAAIQLYRHALELEAVSETLHCALIVCLGKRGQHAEAAAAYQRCNRLLVRLLGIKPTQATLLAFRQATGADVRQEAILSPVS